MRAEFDYLHRPRRSIYIQAESLKGYLFIAGWMAETNPPFLSPLHWLACAHPAQTISQSN